MKYLVIVVVALLVHTNAQRPTYAGSQPKGRPGLASRFKDTTTDTNNSGDAVVSVANRVGEDGSTMKIPIDARGDVDLVNRLSEWDREHQPYWLLNAEQIEAQRNTNRNPRPSQGTVDSRNNQPINRNPQGSLESVANRNSGSGFRNQQGSFNDFRNEDDFPGSRVNGRRTMGSRNDFSNFQDDYYRNAGREYHERRPVFPARFRRSPYFVPLN